jgi:hypothetical protein
LTALNHQAIHEYKIWHQSQPLADTDDGRLRRNNGIDEDLQRVMSFTLKGGMGLLTKIRCDHWKDLSDQLFFCTLQKIFPKKNDNTSVTDSVEERIKQAAAEVVFNLNIGRNAVVDFVKKILHYMAGEEPISTEREARLLKVIRDALKSHERGHGVERSNSAMIPVKTPLARLLQSRWARGRETQDYRGVPR